MSYPKNLSYAVSRLSGYSSQIVKLRCLQNSAATAGDVCVFDLPMNSLVDLSSLRFCGRISTAGGTGANLRHSESLIRQVSVEAGGQIISQTGDHVNILWKIFDDFTQGDKQSSREVYQSGAAIGTAPAAHITARDFYVSQILGFTHSAKPTYIDTSLFPGGSIRISLRLAPNSALVLNGAASYALSDLYMLVTTVDIADGLYYQLLAERLKSGAIEIPFQQIYSFNSGDRPQASASLMFSLSSQSVDMVIGTTIPKSETLNGGALDATIKNSAYFARGAQSGSAPRVSWKINNQVYPSYGEMTAMDCWTETLNAMGLLNDAVGALNPDLNTAAKFEKAFFASAVRFAHNDGDADSRVLSGINALGTNGVGELVYNQTGGTDVSHQLLVFVLTTAVVKLGAGRSMAVTY